ncbi:hypothetical protein JCM10207_002810 [Rhodosporidiobolus poonsookiae]
MRVLTLLALVCTVLATLVLASPPHPPSKNLVQRDRVAVAFGKPQPQEQKRERADKASKGKESNYLVTLERTITNSGKDKILDVLLRSGAVVKEEYNYRVYKGILFTIPSSADKGLTSWQVALTKEAGVKYVEEDSVVKTQ